LVLAGAQTNLNVIKAFTQSNLSERHGQELVPAGEVTDFVIAAVMFDTPVELLLVDGTKDLGENSAHRLIFGIFPALKSKNNFKSVTLDFTRKLP
jgi:hypothetical protein